ncbi:nuclear transport factor 2 family protein [Sphaerisporangium sp. NPDC005289]|uniref:nuclear transport factor 2 family protein n=1 Tax=Sphaerisporangium sp. NPDC005289 TaxID=3155247 RepID=UPI0033BAFB04
MTTRSDRTPRDVLALYQQAMVAGSADDLAGLYAVDAVHEFPFRAPGFPARFHGREEVRAGYHKAWDASPVRLAEVGDVVVHEAADPEVIVAEWRGTGTVGPDGRPFEASGLLMFRVRGGEIVEMRDYMDVFGTFHAIGRLKDMVAAMDAPAAS